MVDVMTRVHDSAYREPEDIYAANRCVNCPHLIYADHKPGDPCLYGAEGCGCTGHRLAELVGGLLAIEGGEES